MRHITPNQRQSPRLLWVTLLALATALLVYSQAVAYFGNESFHLLAAQLINAGKKPYLDFFYQHPPLFVYVIAAWMRVFGENWRSAHILSALLTGGCIVLIADYVYRQLSDSRLRLGIASSVAVLLGLNFFVLCYGTVALPFALCLLLTAAAFRLTLAAAYRPGVLVPFMAGLCAGAATASSLLTAPVLVVLLTWLACYGERPDQLRRCFAFIVGTVLPFLPLIRLGLLSPRQVFFDLVEYHLLYRAGSERNMISWNLREIVGWFGSIQGSTLTALAAIGLTFTLRRPNLGRRQLTEIYLCAWITVVLSVYFATPRPTFSFYFVLITPFMSILAARGLEAIGISDWFSGTRILLIPALILLYSVGLGWQVYKMRREIFYADHSAIEGIAREINQVTPIDGWVFAFEQIYFEARRMPPPGLENGFNPYSRGDEWLAANRFATVCMMADDPRVKSLKLFDRYAHNKAITTPNFTVYLFWDRIAAQSEPSSPQNEEGSELPGLSPSRNALPRKQDQLKRTGGTVALPARWCGWKQVSAQLHQPKEHSRIRSKRTEVVSFSRVDNSKTRQYALSASGIREIEW